jgi:hypothetical protein
MMKLMKLAVHQPVGEENPPAAQRFRAWRASRGPRHRKSAARGTHADPPLKSNFHHPRLLRRHLHDPRHVLLASFLACSSAALGLTYYLYRRVCAAAGAAAEKKIKKYQKP